MRALRHGLLLCGLVLWPVAVRAQETADSLGQVSFRVLPETVTVGQPFVVSLRAIAPRGRTAMAPAVPDTGGLVEPLDPAAVTRRGDTLLVRYRLLAWQPGVLTIPFGPVLMRRDTMDVAVPVDARIVVASVLPLDSAARKPREARDLFAVVTPWWVKWWQWVLGGIVGFALLYLAYRWWTREPATADGDQLSPIAQAERAFARLDARKLVAVGEGGRSVALTAEIVRSYLHAIEPTLHPSLTNSELMLAATALPCVPERRVREWLDRVDAVRFSGQRPAANTLLQLSTAARELVRDIERLRATRTSQAA